MPVLNRLAEFHADIVAIRRDIHTHPELRYEEHRTAQLVAEQLRSYGVDEVETGIGGTGVVGVIRGAGGGNGRVVALRADMDALPIEEATGLPYASQTPGVMHACGHDGHTAMLLAAARYLAETRRFSGTAVLVFQPAEEGGAGAAAMIRDGLFERFGIEQIFGMHNMPNLPVGHFAIRPGPQMAAADRFRIEIEGRGAHAAKPHESIDTVLVGAAIVNALQSIVSRNTDPLASVVVSVTMFHAGFTDNVLPQTAELAGTVRTLNEETRDAAEERLKAIASGIAATFGAQVRVHYTRDYPVTVNHEAEAAFAADVAGEIAGPGAVDRNLAPLMGAEDFSFFLQKVPGAFIFIGNGPSAGLHNPNYNFNDEVIPHGASWLARIVERAMPL